MCQMWVFLYIVVCEFSFVIFPIQWDIFSEAASLQPTQVPLSPDWNKAYSKAFLTIRFYYHNIDKQ